MKSKKTSLLKAFLFSMCSLLVCVSMFVGTTYAWITDSVISGINTVTAGNLDIELTYALAEFDGDGAAVIPDGEGDFFDKLSWKGLEPDIPLFGGEKDSVFSYNPGDVKVVYFKIENTGTLPVQFAFGLNIEEKWEDGLVKISEYLLAGIGEVTVSQGLAEAKGLAVHLISSSKPHIAELQAGERAILMLTVRMPDADEILYFENGTLVENGEALEDTATSDIYVLDVDRANSPDASLIKLGIRLVAIQLEDDIDSYLTPVTEAYLPSIKSN